MNPEALSFRHGSAHHGPSPLLALPQELKDKIALFALQPHQSELSLGLGLQNRYAHQPHRNLTKRLQPFMANKALYKTAVDVYFSTALLYAIVARSNRGCRLSASEPWNDGFKSQIIAGTFEEHPFFFKHATKIRIEIVAYAAREVAKASCVVTACSSLNEIIVWVGNLDSVAERMGFFGAIKDAADTVAYSTERRIRVKMESQAEFVREILSRREAEAEYERMKEVCSKGT